MNRQDKHWKSETYHLRCIQIYTNNGMIPNHWTLNHDTCKVL